MKRLICLLLTVTLILSVTLTASAYSLWQGDDPDASYETITADEAIAAYEAETGEKVETYRYYFMMPDGVHGNRDETGKVPESWYNEYSQGACVYWWEKDTPAACEEWTGYRAMVEDAEQGIYYVNMPTAVSTDFIWNNGVDGGQDPGQPIFEKMKLSVNVPCSYAEPDEWESIPEGCDNFDHCIFVPYAVNIYSEFNPSRPVSGSWYFYYGDGCYGMYATDSENFTDVAHNCCNPDHFDENGVHVGFAEPLRGDYDWDNIVTVIDATRAQRILAGLNADSNPTHVKNVDADNDGALTILDATRIQRVIAGLCDWNGNIREPDELPFVPAH